MLVSQRRCLASARGTFDESFLDEVRLIDILNRAGIFAQRGKNRPNRLGVCVCRVVGVDGLAVEVEGLDAIDGTPVLDIKPVLKGFLPRGEVREPAWATEIMKDYW